MVHNQSSIVTTLRGKKQNIFETFIPVGALQLNQSQSDWDDKVKLTTQAEECKQCWKSNVGLKELDVDLKFTTIMKQFPGEVLLILYF